MNKARIDINKENDKVLIKIKNLGIAIKGSRRKCVVYSPGLNVLGYSKKGIKSALIDFEENLRLYFAVHLKDDTLKQALNSLDWKSVGQSVNFGSKTPNHALEEKDFEIALAA